MNSDTFTSNAAFMGNPHAIFKEGICIDVLNMNDATPEEKEEILENYRKTMSDFDEVVESKAYGHEIMVGFVKLESEDYGTIYSFRRPYRTWLYDEKDNSWYPPVEHPHVVESRENVILNTNYDWDDELVDWVPVQKDPENCGC